VFGLIWLACSPSCQSNLLWREQEMSAHLTFLVVIHRTTEGQLTGLLACVKFYVCCTWMCTYYNSGCYHTVIGGFTCLVIHIFFSPLSLELYFTILGCAIKLIRVHYLSKNCLQFTRFNRYTSLTVGLGSVYLMGRWSNTEVLSVNIIFPLMLVCLGLVIPKL